MATLTETAYYTRKSIKYGSVGLVAFLILRVIWGIGIAYYKQINPPPPPPPTVGFGKIPAINFPKNEGLPQLTYKLETVEGTTPKLDTIGKVYVVPKPVASLLALDRSKDLANKLGFKKAPTQVNERIFRFVGENTNSLLEIDIITQKFRMKYDYANDQSILLDKKLPLDEQAIAEAKNYLRQATLLSTDLEGGPAKVTYWKLVSPNLVPAISLSEADFVRVDLFRADLDNLKVLQPSPYTSQVYLIFSGIRSLDKRIVDFGYSHNPVSPENFATYPLKSSTTAWQELQQGGGFVANLGENQDGNVVIRKVYLAYFDNNGSTDFLQPIFVFEGDRNFVAYVPALDPKWIE